VTNTQPLTTVPAVTSTSSLALVAPAVQGSTTTLDDVNKMTTTASPKPPQTFEEAKHNVAIAMAEEDKAQSDINVAQLKLRQIVQSKAPKPEIIAQSDIIKKKLYDLGHSFNNFRGKQHEYMKVILQNKS
jgi:hypothetical protein